MQFLENASVQKKEENCTDNSIEQLVKKDRSVQITVIKK